MKIYANRLDNIDQMNKSLGGHKVPNYLKNKSIKSKPTKFSQRKVQAQIAPIGILYQKFKKELVLIIGKTSKE
jgi:hypothetical protein